MRLHEDKKLFADAVLATASHLGIKPLFVEKDYWITRSLKLMKEADTRNRGIFIADMGWTRNWLRLYAEPLRRWPTSSRSEVDMVILLTPQLHFVSL